MTPSTLKAGYRIIPSSRTLVALLLGPLLIAPLLLASSPAGAETVRTRHVTVRVDAIADGLDHPWSVEVLPDGAYIVSERPGRLRIVRDGRLGQPLEGLPAIYARGQGGLMDIALSPQFATDRILFFTASVPGGGGSGTAVFRARLADDERSLEQLTRIFAMNRFTPGNIQYGARIAIAADGNLFVSLGDRGARDRAQDFADHAGSIIRIDRDGRPVAGNPFAGGGRGLPELWSKGHRNPQGIAIDAKDGKIYTAEHGARGGDEINEPEAVKNYGWPIITYGVDYSGAPIGEGTTKDGLEQPLHYWDPSIAPGAIAVYRGAMFPEWDGDFLVAALKYRLIARVEHREDGTSPREERLFEGAFGRIRDLIVAPDGALLFVTDEDKGGLYRVTRAKTE